MNYAIDGAGQVTWCVQGEEPVEVTGGEADLVRRHACLQGRADGCPPLFDDGGDVPGVLEELTAEWEAAYDRRVGAGDDEEVDDGDDGEVDDS